MEVIRTVGSVMGSIKMLVDLIEINKKRRCELARGLKSMNMDFEMITSVRLRRKDGQLQLPAALQLKLQELAYDIDDFIQGLWIPGELGSFILSAIGADTRPGLVERVGGFKERIKNLKEELPGSFGSVSSGGTSMSAGPSMTAATASPIHYAPEVDLVGIEGPKKDIMELLAPRVEPHVGRLSVICIAGCSGSGKTSLARVLYEDEDVANKFDFLSWVVASDPGSADIVNKIHEEAVPRYSNPEAHHFQKDKRYLVFVDDVLGETPWKDTQNAFSENVMDSRIIVTTRVPSVAMECSSGSFVYTMQGLDKENSRELFRRKFRGKAGYSEQDKYRLGDTDVDVIVNKCDGLPIALISAAESLRRKGLNPVNDDFIKVSQELSDHLAFSHCAFEEFQKQNGIATTFAEMRRARVEPYENNLNNGEKECLLYVSMFPCGHEINSKSLVRRLIAEGLVPTDPDIVKPPESVFGDVRACVMKLMSQRMIEPVPIHNYSNVAKRCRIHSIMLEFTIKKAISRNFVSLIHKDQPLHNKNGKVRRLTVQSSPLVRGNKCPEGMNLSVLRSLAIFKSTILDFKKCKLVRVLDLEGCGGLQDKDLNNICGLQFLKFLSLRNTGIQKLPENVKELMFLEMLDTRGTRETLVIKFPVEVIMLPRFAYLFGMFELTNVQSNNMEKIIKFFSKKKSQLHTLGGIAVHESKGLEIVLLVVQHATRLAKVKVWYRNTPSSTDPVTTSTSAAGGTHKSNHVGLLRNRKPYAGPPGDPIPSARKQGMFKHKSNPVELFSKQKLSAEPSTDTSSNIQDPAPAISVPVANGTVQPIYCASKRGLFKHKLDHVWLSTEQSTDCNTNILDTTTATPTPMAGSTPGSPSAGPSADSRGDTPDPAPATSTPLASDTPELIDCASRLIEALKTHPTTLKSVSIDFNGVTNTLLDFHQINDTISSIKLGRGQGSLPGPDKLGKVCNLKKLHLFSTGVESEELAALQHLKCLQYLKLAEDGDGLWESEFHVKVGGFISLIWLCFEAPKLPPIKIDKGAMTVLASLQVLCPVGHVVTDISHLEKLNEVILHRSSTDDEVAAWKEEAKKHINRPYVEKQQV